MGKKLTDEEVEALIKENPNVMFDICSVCNGSEESISMELVDEDNDSFDLICDECKAERKAERKLKKSQQ